MSFNGVRPEGLEQLTEEMNERVPIKTRRPTAEKRGGGPANR
jgi:hypothetical protein